MGKRRGKKGNISMILVLSSVLLILCFSLASVSSLTLSLARSSVEYEQAFYTARSVVAQTLFRMDRAMDSVETVPLTGGGASFFTVDFSSGVFDDLGSVPPGEVTISFSRTGRTYSTDNLGGEYPAGKNGYGYGIPPYCLDLVIPVKIGGSQRVFEAVIGKRWPYALFSSHEPVYLDDTAGANAWLALRGDVYSLFNRSGYAVVAGNGNGASAGRSSLEGKLFSVRGEEERPFFISPAFEENLKPVYKKRMFRTASPLKKISLPERSLFAQVPYAAWNGVSDGETPLVGLDVKAWVLDVAETEETSFFVSGKNPLLYRIWLKEAAGRPGEGDGAAEVRPLSARFCAEMLNFVIKVWRERPGISAADVLRMSEGELRTVREHLRDASYSGGLAAMIDDGMERYAQEPFFSEFMKECLLTCILYPPGDFASSEKDFEQYFHGFVQGGSGAVEPKIRLCSAMYGLLTKAGGCFSLRGDLRLDGSVFSHHIIPGNLSNADPEAIMKASESSQSGSGITPSAPPVFGVQGGSGYLDDTVKSTPCKIVLENCTLMVDGDLELRDSAISGSNASLIVTGNVLLEGGDISSSGDKPFVLYGKNIQISSGGKYRGVMLSPGTILLTPGGAGGSAYGGEMLHIRGGIACSGMYSPRTLPSSPRPFDTEDGLLLSGTSYRRPSASSMMKSDPRQVLTIRCTSLEYDSLYMKSLNQIGVPALFFWREI